MSDLSKHDAKAREIVAKYEQKRAAMLPLLHLGQEIEGLMTPEVEEWVSGWVDEPLVHVHEVVTFYSMYHRKKRGECHIRFCTSTSCVLRDGDHLYEYVKEKLKLKDSDVTSDGKFSIESAECLCACEVAPMMQVNDTYVGPLTKEKIDAIINK
jgi:NADH-quinone oxidoreductase E subunit